MKIGHPEARYDCLLRWVFHNFPIRYPDSLNQTSLTQQFGLQWPYWQVLLQVLSQLPPLMWVPGYTLYRKMGYFFVLHRFTADKMNMRSRLQTDPSWGTSVSYQPCGGPSVRCLRSPVQLAYSWRQEGLTAWLSMRKGQQSLEAVECVEMPGNLRRRFILVDQFVWVLSILLYIGSFQVHFPCLTCQPSASHPVARRANWRLLQWVALWSTAAWFETDLAAGRINHWPRVLVVFAKGAGHVSNGSGRTSKGVIEHIAQQILHKNPKHLREYTIITIGNAESHQLPKHPFLGWS